MKLSCSWLREWVNPRISNDELAELLIQAGIEIEESTTTSVDTFWSVKITPNRGDALSVLGIAREVAIKTGIPLKWPFDTASSKTREPGLSLNVETPTACPYYSAQIINNIDPKAPTPPWMRARLESAGFKTNNLIVDVTQYVMLELGQPMHAFDLSHVEGGLHVRYAKADETLKLLNEVTLTLKPSDLVIASDHVLALAGIMGGLESGIQARTTDILLESAHFSAEVLQQSAQTHKLQSDALYRFERGVDPKLCEQALNRACQLLQTYGQGRLAGCTVSDKRNLYTPKQTFKLRHAQVKRLLGLELTSAEIEHYLSQLSISFTAQPDAWFLTAPSWRRDLEAEIDVIEELVRLHGFDKLLEENPKQIIQYPKPNFLPEKLMQAQLQALGYSEVINYSFIDPFDLSRFNPDETYHLIDNPLSSERSAMRLSLLPGLCDNVAYNRARQQNCIKLFEVGMSFNDKNPQVQTRRLSFVAQGLAVPEQWGQNKRPIDFYDFKEHLMACLGVLGMHSELVFKKTNHPALHPGQSAEVVFDGRPLGILGKLHPSLLKSLGALEPIYVCELNLSLIAAPKPYQSQAISKYPLIKRDIALIVSKFVTAAELLELIQQLGGPNLTHSVIFDVYEGRGIAGDQKSIALSLFWQHPLRTLQEIEVQKLQDEIVQGLAQTFKATLRH